MIGTGHTVTNNYFYNLRGENFRSPLAVMNGIPKSPLNRYIQVTDVTVAHNSWINCTAPLQFGVGSNISQKDVLPASEIRSERPKRTVVANNLIHNEEGDKSPVVAHDKLDGILFQQNLINNQGVDFDEIDGIKTSSFGLKEIAEYIYTPTINFPSEEIYKGFGFEEFSKDLFGVDRGDNNAIGAIVGQPTSAPPILDGAQYGTDWFNPDLLIGESMKHTVKSGQNVNEVFAQAADGDVIILVPGVHMVSTPIVIDKKLTISTGTRDGKATLKYQGPAETPLFEMNPDGKLSLNNIEMEGKGTQYAFASLRENMSSLYNLTVDNCSIENFDYVLKAYKYSFSEHIHFLNSTIQNCQNGLELSGEDDDKGDYNAENIVISDCTFDGVESNVVDYYRGGYDESTVGGDLKVTGSTFTNCGAKEKNGILLNTYGIINVDISGNKFVNNKVQQVAQLWGAQNNTHSNNTITNSGKIVVEENLKLKTFY